MSNPINFTLQIFSPDVRGMLKYVSYKTLIICGVIYKYVVNLKITIEIDNY